MEIPTDPAGPVLLLLETAAEMGSFALSRGMEVLAYRQTQGPREHAQTLVSACAELLAEAGLTRVDGVAVSAGPGSYTGLRIGYAAAKAYALAWEAALLEVPTLEILAAVAQAAAPGSELPIRPLLDARRMEVYTARYDTALHLLEPAEARILTPEYWAEEARRGPCRLLGDGLAKCLPMLAAHPELLPMQGLGLDARAMLRPALRRWDLWQYSPLVEAEPHYLKGVATTAPRRPQQLYSPPA